MIKFLADENFPLPNVKRLRAVGYDIAAVIIDSPGDSDENILRRGAKEESIILTFDRDFGELVFRLKLPAPGGIVYFRFDPATPEEPADFLGGFWHSRAFLWTRSSQLLTAGKSVNGR